MSMRIFVSALVLALLIASGSCGCGRDRNVQFQNPLYLNYGNGFFYIQGLTNGEAVVIYKHPDDTRIFGQYTFKDERCLYETVYYYVLNGKYEFTNPYIVDEANFNITNKINFVKDGAGYEIEYNVSPKGVGIFQNLGAKAEKKILPDPSIKKTPAPKPAREFFPRFENVGKQNLKVSYMKNGENYIQFITNRNTFPSMEGQYTMRTSDRKYHSITYEIPLDFDYNEMIVREYEISTEENFYKTGTIRLALNNTDMDVKYFVNSNGFHVSDIERPGVQKPVVSTPPKPSSAPRPTTVASNRPQLNNRPVRNQQVRGSRPGSVNGRVLNPSFARPELLTGERSIRPGK